MKYGDDSRLSHCCEYLLCSCVAPARKNRCVDSMRRNGKWMSVQPTKRTQPKNLFMQRLDPASATNESICLETATAPVPAGFVWTGNNLRCRAAYANKITCKYHTMLINAKYFIQSSYTVIVCSPHCGEWLLCCSSAVTAVLRACCFGDVHCNSGHCE